MQGVGTRETERELSGETFKRLPLVSFCSSGLSPSMLPRGSSGGCATCASGGTPSLFWCERVEAREKKKRRAQTEAKRERSDCFFFFSQSTRKVRVVHFFFLSSSPLSVSFLLAAGWAFAFAPRPGPPASLLLLLRRPRLSQPERWRTPRLPLLLLLRRRREQQQRHRRRRRRRLDPTPATATAPGSTPASAPTRWRDSARPAGRASRPLGSLGWSRKEEPTHLKKVKPLPSERPRPRGAPPPLLPQQWQRRQQQELPLAPSGPGS